MRRKLAIISLTFFMASGVVGALTPQDKPLTKDQVMGLVRNRLGDYSGAKVVEQRGIDFEPTDDFLRSLREAGADDVFLKAVRDAKQSAKNQPAASGPLDIFEISDMLLKGVPSQRVVDLIRQWGIAFLPSPEFLQLLKDMGAEPALLDAIRNSKAIFDPAGSEAGRRDAAAAEQDYREVTRREPGNVSARIFLVLALNTQGKYADALQALREGIRVRPDSAILHYYLAEGLSNQLVPNTYDAQGAVAEFREVLRLDPNYAGAHFGLGLALEGQGDLDGAIAEDRQALVLNPKDEFARSSLGRVLERKGDLDGAIAEYREDLEVNPHGLMNPFVRSSLGRALERKGDLEEAIAQYRESVRISPTYGLPHSNLGLALLKKGSFDEGVAECREGARLGPKDGIAHVCLGYASQQKGDLDGALAECREGERLSPKDADAHFIVGSILQKKGDLPAAREEYRTALTLAPNNPTYRKTYESLSASSPGSGATAAPTAQKPQSEIERLTHADLLASQGDLDGAIAAYREVLRFSPTFGTARLGLAGLLLRKGSLDEAMAEYREVARQDPNDTRGHTALGNLLIQKGDTDGALAEFRESERLDPKDANAHYLVGSLLEKKGDLPAAREEYHTALTLEPNNPAHRKAYESLYASLSGSSASAAPTAQRPQSDLERLNHADLLASKGDLDGAIAEDRELVRISPTYGLAHSHLGWALLREGSVDEALTECREGARLLPDNGQPHMCVGDALQRKGDSDGAVAELREAVRLAPNDSLSHWSLGFALSAKGDKDGGVAE